VIIIGKRSDGIESLEIIPIEIIDTEIITKITFPHKPLNTILS